MRTSQLAKKGGETIIMKFVKILAVVAIATAALGLGACASKPKPNTPPASVGLRK
jgi:hypothetical protein